MEPNECSAENSEPLQTGIELVQRGGTFLDRARLPGPHDDVPAQSTASGLLHAVSVFSGVLLPAFHLQLNIFFQSGSEDAGNISCVPRPADETLRGWQEAVRERTLPSGRTSCMFFNRT